MIVRPMPAPGVTADSAELRTAGDAQVPSCAAPGWEETRSG